MVKTRDICGMSTLSVSERASILPEKDVSGEPQLLLRFAYVQQSHLE